ncbi:MAG: flavin reductase family protein [Clostridia bacterium]|nr:flavin reductase family protein [Clostridia bacterium]
MNRFKEIDVNEVKDNFISLIGKDYALITVKNDDKINMMTASWGFFGVMWNKNAVSLVIRPSRYTYQFLKEGSEFTINFLQNGYDDVLKFCGTKSGRDYNKVKETGLTPIEICKNSVLFSESKLAFLCKKVYVQDMDKNLFCNKDFSKKMYPDGDVHTMFIAEIEKVYCLKD